MNTTLTTIGPRLFNPGQTVITPGALDAITQAEQHPGDFLTRHLAGDWGDLCEEDRQTNEQALGEGLRLLSSYQTKTNRTIWIITESDGSATTLLLPEEY